MLVVLDSGPLGMLANHVATPTTERASTWVRALIVGGHQVVVPEIADFEVRRELLRSDRSESVRRLDELCAGLGFVPLTSSAWRSAAGLWADARNRHRPTAPDHALDGDVLLAALALELADDHPDVVVATTNAKHLSRYVTARRWDQIAADLPS